MVQHGLCVATFRAVICARSSPRRVLQNFSPASRIQPIRNRQLCKHIALIRA